MEGWSDMDLGNEVMRSTLVFLTMLPLKKSGAVLNVWPERLLRGETVAPYSSVVVRAYVSIWQSAAAMPTAS